MRMLPLHRRRSLRLAGWDYTRVGAYFITICAYERACLFGEIADDRMILSPIGLIVRDQWAELESRFDSIVLDTFVVMPNHVHGILSLTGGPAQPSAERGTRDPGPNLGRVVAAYKSTCVQACLRRATSQDPPRRLGSLWQRNYWEHVIRTEVELQKMREYVVNNPLSWAEDELRLGVRPAYMTD